MQIDVAFANPIGPYNNIFNRIIPKYCHCELSFHTTTSHLKRMVVQHMETNKDELIKLKKRLDKINGKIIVCFFITWGSTVSCRFLTELIDDPYHRPPEQPVYDVKSLKVTMEQMDNLIYFYLKNLGKRYDYVRALLCLLPYTLRECDYNSFFCSQLVLKSLIDAKIFKKEGDINENHITPSELYKLL